jgi:hypothetical protein
MIAGPFRQDENTNPSGQRCTMSIVFMERTPASARSQPYVIADMPAVPHGQEGNQPVSAWSETFRRA